MSRRTHEAVTALREYLQHRNVSAAFPSRPLVDYEFGRIVTNGGGRYRGLMPITPHQTALVLFDSRESRTTLALPMTELTEENVRQEIEKSNASFGVRPCSR